MDCSIDDDSIAMGNISLRKKNSADRPKKQNSIIHKPSPATTSASTEYKKSRRKPMGEIDGNLQETMMLPEGVDPEAKKDTPKAISSKKNLSSLAVQRPSKKDSDRQRHFPIWFPFKQSLQTNIVPIQGERVDIPVPEPEWSNEYDPISMDSIQFMPIAADSEFTSFFQNSFTDHKGSDGGSKLNDSSNRNLPMALNSNSVCLSSKDQKKNGSVLPIKVNRGGERTQPLRRGIHKKQRAAHQAASPPSQASHSFSDHSLQCRTREPSPTPKVRQIMGKRVTIIDEELKVFVVDLLTPETCELVRSMTDAHVRQVSENGNQVPTWRTLYTYTKQDLPVCEVKNLNTLVSEEIMVNIRAIVGELYQNEKEAQKLRPRSWKEPHLLLYQKIEGKPLHTGVEMHYDGCDITWNCMLSKSDEYEGGGTYIRALRKTVRLEQGQVLVHPGELYHKGCDITSGVRALIVCFMDGFDPMIQDPSSSKENSAAFEQNVRMY